MISSFQLSTTGWRKRFKERFLKTSVLCFLGVPANTLFNFMLGGDVSFGWGLISELLVLIVLSSIVFTALFSLFEEDVL